MHLTAAQPGARALVLAGAGIGLTDDASGTVLNPATLRFLVRGEVNGGLVMTFPTAPFIWNTSLRSNFTASDLTFRDEDLDPTANIFFAIAYPAARFSWAAFARIAASPNEVPTAGPIEEGRGLGGGLLVSTLKAKYGQYGAATSIPLGSNASAGVSMIVDHIEVRGAIPGQNVTLQGSLVLSPPGVRWRSRRPNHSDSRSRLACRCP